MTSGNVPLCYPPGGTSIPPVDTSSYEVAVRYANMCNHAVRKLKTHEKSSCYACVNPVSNDEVEQPVPSDPASFVFLRLPETGPTNTCGQAEPERLGDILCAIRPISISKTSCQNSEISVEVILLNLMFPTALRGRFVGRRR